MFSQAPKTAASTNAPKRGEAVRNGASAPGTEPGAESFSGAATDDASEERARQIVRAAYELLQEEGLDGLTIRAVLNRTGLSRRAFYERFAGKDDLMLAVFQHSILAAIEQYSQMFASIPDPMERVKFIITSISLGEGGLDGETAQSVNRRGAALSREHLRLSECRPNDLQRALQPLFALIAEQLADGMKQGKVRTDYEPQRLAVLVYNLVSTTAHKEFLSGDPADEARARRAQLAADIWEFCRRAIAA